MRLVPKFISHAFSKIYILTTIKISGLFDAQWYTEKYLKGVDCQMTPIKHYIRVGYLKGYSPSPKFSHSRYITAYPLIHAQGRNPLMHYLFEGRYQGYVCYGENSIGKYNDATNPIRPLVSIIVTSYNYAQYIPETLDSLLKQTYDNYEIIVVDDGSKDNSVDVINEYVSKNDKIKLLLHPNRANKGIIASMKLAIENAKGDFIAFCESDDYWAPNHLEKKVEMINKYKDVCIVSNNIQLVGDPKCIEQREEYISVVRKLLRDGGNKIDLRHNQEVNFIPTFSSVMIKKDVLQSLNFESPIPAWIDFWLYRQILKNNLLFFVDEKLTFWRQHASYNGADFIEDKFQVNNAIFLPASDNLIGIKNSMQKEEGLESVRNSPLFDCSYYLKNVRETYGLKPSMHYCTIGWREGDNPSAKFHNNAYLTQHVELIPVNMCPLDHYEYGGRKEGRIMHSVHEVEEHSITQSDVEKIQSIRKDKKTILLFSHDLSMTGAPRALLNLAVSLKKQGAHPVILSRQEGVLLSELESEGIDYKIAYSLITRKASPANEIPFKDYASCFDVVLFNTISTLPLIREIKDITSKKICWVHEGWMSIQSFSFNNKAKYYLDLFDEILVVGRYAENILRKEYPSLKSVNQFLYGIKDIPCVPKESEPTSSKIKLIMAATIDARKGHDILIKALNLLPSDVLSKLDITIAGNEHDKNLASMLRSQENIDIHILGEVEHESLLKMISQSDVLLCTSIDDPMPISCTEAMMFGVPTLVSDNTGTASFIQDGVNGFVFESGNIKMLAEKFIYIVNHLEALPDIGQRAKTIYTDNFCPCSFNNNVRNIFLT